jgi:hypothetical protein
MLFSDKVACRDDRLGLGQGRKGQASTLHSNMGAELFSKAGAFRGKAFCGRSAGAEGLEQVKYC